MRLAFLLLILCLSAGGVFGRSIKVSFDPKGNTVVILNINCGSVKASREVPLLEVLETSNFILATSDKLRLPLAIVKSEFNFPARVDDVRSLPGLLFNLERFFAQVLDDTNENLFANIFNRDTAGIRIRLLSFFLGYRVPAPVMSMVVDVRPKPDLYHSLFHGCPDITEGTSQGLSSFAYSCDRKGGIAKHGKPFSIWNAPVSGKVEVDTKLFNTYCKINEGLTTIPSLTPKIVLTADGKLESGAYGDKGWNEASAPYTFSDTSFYYCCSPATNELMPAGDFKEIALVRNGVITAGVNACPSPASTVGDPDFAKLLRSIGKTYKKGYKKGDRPPKFELVRPVVFLPGLMSSRLRVINDLTALASAGIDTECAEKFAGKNVWVPDLNAGAGAVKPEVWRRCVGKLLGTIVKNVTGKAASYDRQIVQPVEGMSGCRFLLQSILVGTDTGSQVLWRFEKALKLAKGIEGKDYFGFTYDWRMSPTHLQQAGYFQKLKQLLEAARAEKNHPVVIVAHSLGNLVLMEFLRYIRRLLAEGSESWIATHIFTYVAVGPPFMGAPKAFRMLAGGDTMGLSAPIHSIMPTTLDWMRELALGISGTTFLAPKPVRTKDDFKYDLKSFVSGVPFYEDASLQQRDIPAPKRLAIASRPFFEQFCALNAGEQYYDDPAPPLDVTTPLDNSLKNWKELADNNQLDERFYRDFVKSIPHIYCVYGWNIPTELGTREIKATGEKLYAKVCAKKNDDRFFDTMGDGTVPTVSASFCRTLTGSIETRVQEVDHTVDGEHVAIIWNTQHTIAATLLYAGNFFRDSNYINRPGQLVRQGPNFVAETKHQRHGSTFPILSGILSRSLIEAPGDNDEIVEVPAVASEAKICTSTATNVCEERQPTFDSFGYVVSNSGDTHVDLDGRSGEDYQIESLAVSVGSRITDEVPIKYSYKVEPEEQVGEPKSSTREKLAAVGRLISDTIAAKAAKLTKGSLQPGL